MVIIKGFSTDNLCLCSYRHAVIASGCFSSKINYYTILNCVWVKEKSRSSAKALRLLLTAAFTSADHKALEWRLMRPTKGMKNLAAFSAREVNKVAAEERDEYSSAEGQWESKSSLQAF